MTEQAGAFLDSKSLPLQAGVKILLRSSEGKHLLLRRNPKAYPDVRPSWDIPGGRINLGLPLLENLRREVREEAGLDIVGQPALVAAQDIIRPDKHVVRLTYRGTASGWPVLMANTWNLPGLPPGM
ncbi:MAG TPA: NUDIX hydrolase [Patescibacteria group bacterium]|nr:NUDIX hydrolase [Patescibacteria group bacterium]